MKCFCHSGLNYSECCEPFHKKIKLPKTPKELMRSRYSAYALGLADYIIDTTYPESPLYEKNLEKWKRSILEFSNTTRFIGLDIENESDDKVTFFAMLNTLGKDTSFRERSLFKKENGKWQYVKPLTC
jgi:SEC-C motif-containing protein